MDSEGCLPPPNPHRALIFPFKFNQVTVRLVPSRKMTCLCLSTEPREGKEMGNTMGGATELLWEQHPLFRGQVTCTGPRSHLVTKVVSLSLLNCIKTHYYVHLCSFPGWKENQASTVSRTGPKFPPPIIWPLLVCCIPPPMS